MIGQAKPAATGLRFAPLIAFACGILVVWWPDQTNEKGQAYAERCTIFGLHLKPGALFFDREMGRGGELPHFRDALMAAARYGNL